MGTPSLLRAQQDAWVMGKPTLSPFADAIERGWVIKPRDPERWMRERLGGHPWSKQVEIFDSVRDHRKTAVKSCHNAGKSFSASAVAAWWIDTHPAGEAIVVTTAPSFVQVNVILWEEIRKRHREGDLMGKIGMSAEWKSDNGTIIGLGRKPSDSDEHGFQGIHRPYVLAIIDEACGVPQQLWTAIEAITTTADCKILAIGNPDDPATEFAKVCKPGSGWNVLKISAFDTPNMTGEEMPPHILKMMLDPEWVEDKKRSWGEGSPRYQSKVLGEFPESGINTVLAPLVVEEAIQREFEHEDGGKLGVDVARYGTDNTVITHIAPNGRLRVVATLPMSSTTEAAEKAVEVAAELGWPDITVDGTGVGAGVVDELRRLKREGAIPYDVTIRDFNSAGAPKDPKEFANARAEAVWAFRQAMVDGEVEIDPEDEELASQLVSVRYKINLKGKIQIESKDEMAKRGMPSPDRFDSAYLAYTNLGAEQAPVGSLDRKVVGTESSAPTGNPFSRRVGNSPLKR